MSPKAKGQATGEARYRCLLAREDLHQLPFAVEAHCPSTVISGLAIDPDTLFADFG